MTPPKVRKPDAISADDARRLAVEAQGFGLDASRPKTVAGMLERTGAVQLDTISVIARSHELVAYARLGPVGREAVEAAYWGTPARAFEGHAHANCIVPIALWPYFAFRRRAARARPLRFTTERALNEVRARLRDGPVTASDLGGARQDAGGWWNWSEAKVAVERLYYTGEAVCTTRNGWKRVYDLPERAIPAALLARELSDEECYRHLVAQSVRALGVGTVRDIAEYYRLATSWTGIAPDARRLLREAIDDCGLVPVEVEGWPEIAFADPAALRRRTRPALRTTLLSPFDSLVWANGARTKVALRERTHRVFGHDILFEAYVPKEKRVHGYFIMPLLAGGRIAGHVDPKRDGTTLIARNVTLHDGSAIGEMATALREAASWVGCDDVRIERASPRGALTELRRAVR